MIAYDMWHIFKLMPMMNLDWMWQMPLGLVFWLWSFFKWSFFQVFWCYMRIAYLSAGLLKVLQVVYGDLRYVTSLEKIQTQNTFEIFLKQTAEDVPFHKFSLYLNSRILEFILTSRTYMHKNFQTQFPSHLSYLSIWRCQS